MGGCDSKAVRDLAPVYSCEAGVHVAQRPGEITATFPVNSLGTVTTFDPSLIKDQVGQAMPHGLSHFGAQV